MSDTEKLGYGYKVTPRVVTSKVTPLRDGIIVEENEVWYANYQQGFDYSQ